MYFIVNETTGCIEKFEYYYDAYDRESILKSQGESCTTYSSVPVAYKKDQNFYSHDRLESYEEDDLLACIEHALKLPTDKFNLTRIIWVLSKTGCPQCKQEEWYYGKGNCDLCAILRRISILISKFSDNKDLEYEKEYSRIYKKSRDIDHKEKEIQKQIDAVKDMSGEYGTGMTDKIPICERNKILDSRESGIYAIWSPVGECVYVGQAVDVLNRLNSHFSSTIKTHCEEYKHDREEYYFSYNLVKEDEKNPKFKEILNVREYFFQLLLKPSHSLNDDGTFNTHTLSKVKPITNEEMKEHIQKIFDTKYDLSSVSLTEKENSNG